MNNACTTSKNTGSPWIGLQDLESQLDRIFRGVNAPTRSGSGTWVPAVDVYETNEAYLLQADLPGLTKEDIEVQVIEDQISIRGTRKRVVQPEQKGYQHFERPEGRFERSFRVKGGIDAARVEARFEHGVLTVTLPKPEEARPRHIDVKVT
jgi:HSP20 family protein